MSQATSQSEPRIHLAYLDGIRGLAALYVVLHHTWQLAVSDYTKSLPSWFKALTIFKFGSYGVAVFIVLSGYCLMLPVVQSGTSTNRNGFIPFMKRRARRILPPYYAGLLLSLLLIVLFPVLQRPTGLMWDIALPALTGGSILSHVALIHNLIFQWRWSIDPPLWSVALEWQIYFLFALVLLPLWRKFGNVATLVTAFSICLVMSLAGLSFCAPWLILLFAVGMATAALNFSPGASVLFARIRTHGISLSSIVFGVLFVLSLLSGRTLSPLTSATLDVMAGLAAALFITGYTDRLKSGRKLPAINYLLSHRMAVGLGHFSYSLYLIHYPLIALAFLSLAQLGLRPVPNFFLCVGVFVPLVILVAYLFHCVFERPFLRPAKRS